MHLMISKKIGWLTQEHEWRNEGMNERKKKKRRKHGCMIEKRNFLLSYWNGKEGFLAYDFSLFMLPPRRYNWKLTYCDLRLNRYGRFPRSLVWCGLAFGRPSSCKICLLTYSCWLSHICSWGILPLTYLT